MLRGAAYIRTLRSSNALLAEGCPTGRMAEGWAHGRMAEGWRCSPNLVVPSLARLLDHLLVVGEVLGFGCRRLGRRRFRRKRGCCRLVLTGLLIEAVLLLHAL